ncbi:hypothetical protein JOB18_016270 [Solea senegalensis]|uniref:Uncharacterized protein n=1 Tax=Solea senegalensis TaxID=28829 RepID=A0AAV6QP80_SOLSE|nr:hypothetical protein JOB18_016270 [Solea senegalensis]
MLVLLKQQTAKSRERQQECSGHSAGDCVRHSIIVFVVREEKSLMNVRRKLRKLWMNSERLQPWTHLCDYDTGLIANVAHSCLDEEEEERGPARICRVALLRPQLKPG